MKTDNRFNDCERSTKELMANDEKELSDKNLIYHKLRTMHKVDLMQI